MINLRSHRGCTIFLVACSLLAGSACQRDQQTTAPNEDVVPGVRGTPRDQAVPPPRPGGSSAAPTPAPRPVAKPAASDADNAPEPLPLVDTSRLEPVSQKQIAEQAAAVRAQPENAEAAGTLAMLYHAYGLLEEAGSMYRRAAQLDPDDFRWAYLYAQALLGQERFPEAATQLRHARELRPDYLPAGIWLAQALMRGGDTLEAARVAEALHQEHPDSDVARYTVGLTAIEAQQPVWGIEFLKPLLDEHPEYGAVRAAVAQCFRDLGQEDRAEEILAAGPDNAAAPTLRDPELLAAYRLPVGTEAEIRKALANLAAGHVEAALARYDAALEFSPNNIEALIGRADALVRLGRIAPAEAALQQALEHDPTSLAVLLRLAQLHLATERFDAAEPLVDRIIEGDENQALAWAMRAQIALARGDHRSAVDALERVVALEPGNAQAHLQLGAVRWALQQHDQAVQTLQRAAELAPQDAQVLETLALAYQAQGEQDAAATWYERAYRHGARSPQVCEQVAQQAMETGRFNLVKEALLRGLETDPGNVDLSDALVRLYALCPDPVYRDGKEALRLARLIHGDNEAEIPVRGLNTLAAAHAEIGDFAEAARLTEVALARLGDLADARQRAKLESNLAAYEHNQRLYEPRPRR